MKDVEYITVCTVKGSYVMRKLSMASIYAILWFSVGFRIMIHSDYSHVFNRRFSFQNLCIFYMKLLLFPRHMENCVSLIFISACVEDIWFIQREEMQ